MKFFRSILLTAIAALLAPCFVHAGALGMIPGPNYLGDTIIIDFDSFASTGASSATTGLATSDIKVYKYCATGSFSITEFSNSGYTLVDTDGLDVDGRTGFNAVALDTSDGGNSWASGCDYLVNIDSVTIDSQTVRMTARFKLDPNVVSYGTIAASSTTSVAMIGASSVSQKWVTAVIWNVTTNEKRCITVATDNGSTDSVTFSPNVNAAWTNGDRYKIINADVPCYPVTQPALGPNNGVLVDGFIGGTTTHYVDATTADNFIQHYKNASVTSTWTLDNDSTYAIATKAETDLIGTPPNLLGGGATLAAQINAVSGLMGYGTCGTSSDTTQCRNSSLTQADNYWNNWLRVIVSGQPPRCVRGFNATNDALLWTDALPSTSLSQTFILQAATDCRSQP